MRKSGALVLLLAGLLVVSQAIAQSSESSTRPPKNLKKVGDHWTPWDPPPAGPDAYIIVEGRHPVGPGRALARRSVPLAPDLGREPLHPGQPLDLPR